MLRQEQKDQTFLDIAMLLGSLGTCSRGQVGALIVREGRCITWGFNGSPSGLPHCNENQHGYSVLGSDNILRKMKPEPYTREIEEHGCQNATHAEANALAYAARQGISTEGGTLYVECAPCVNCARLLVAAGVSRIVYRRTYRDPSGLHLLVAANLQVTQLAEKTFAQDLGLDHLGLDYA